MSTLRYTIDWYCTCTWQYIDWTATIRHQTTAAWPYNTQFIFKLYVVYVTYTALFDGSEGNKNHEGCMSKQLTACRYEKCIQICSITLDHYVQSYTFKLTAIIHTQHTQCWRLLNMNGTYMHITITLDET